MFPTPIDRVSAPVRGLYKAALPLSLLLWLAPIVAVALTSIRGQADLNAANGVVHVIDRVLMPPKK